MRLRNKKSRKTKSTHTKLNAKVKKAISRSEGTIKVELAKKPVVVDINSLPGLKKALEKGDIVAKIGDVIVTKDKVPPVKKVKKQAKKKPAAKAVPAVPSEKYEPIRQYQEGLKEGFIKGIHENRKIEDRVYKHSASTPKQWGDYFSDGKKKESESYYKNTGLWANSDSDDDHSKNRKDFEKETGFNLYDTVSGDKKRIIPYPPMDLSRSRWDSSDDEPTNQTYGDLFKKYTSGTSGSGAYLDLRKLNSMHPTIFLPPATHKDIIKTKPDVYGETNMSVLPTHHKIFYNGPINVQARNEPQMATMDIKHTKGFGGLLDKERDRNMLRTF